MKGRSIRTIRYIFVIPALFCFPWSHQSFGQSPVVLTDSVDEQQNAGQYEVTLDGSRLSSWVYFYRIDAGTFTATKKFVLMK